MKIYGRNQTDESDLAILRQVTIVAEPDILRELASFLYRCADGIEERGDGWEHEEFEISESVAPDIVVFNPNVVED